MSFQGIGLGEENVDDLVTDLIFAMWVDRCTTDHNVDNTTEILREWLTAMESQYRYIEWRAVEEPSSYPDEIGPKHWTNGRFEHVMRLKQEALSFARTEQADYILGYYRRTADYFPTKNRQRIGCFPVPMVYAAFLIDLRKSDTASLAFYPPHPRYTWPFDDIIVFAYSCEAAGAQIYLCNQEHFGYINVPVKSHQTLEDERINFVHLILEAMVDGPPMLPSSHVYLPPKHPTKIGFDEIFLINLARRPDRRQRMLDSLFELEIEPLVVNAVDGSALNSSDIKKLGVNLLPDYYDPFSGRTLTKGEVGCFLSHHHVWKEIVERGLERSVVLEDDVRFEAYFKERLLRLMNDLEQVQMDWDLIYLGRKQVNSEVEELVEDVRNLVIPEYSYWTLAYVISRQGAQKLIDAQPLSKILPVDEFLPIMYDKHPNEDYKNHFSNRDLQAYSVHPLLAYPTHYTGDARWMSDTETSTIWDDDSRKTDWSGSQKTLKDARAKTTTVASAMAPKKKAGRKKEEATKEPEIDDDIVPEHSREFYLIQIRDLEGRLASEELFRTEYEKMVRDNKEIVAFLKKTLNQRVDEIADLTAQLQNLQLAKDTEKDAFEAQLAQLRHEFQETKDVLTSENMTLGTKLAGLEEFRLQKDEVMAKFAELEGQLTKQKEEHKATIYNMEKKAVIDKERLKRDMLHRVNTVAAEFRKVSNNQMAETTKRTIRENVAISIQLTKITEQSLQLIQENDRLKEAHAETLKHLQLLEQNEKLMAKNSVSNQKMIWMLTNKCKELQAQVDEYMNMKKAMAQTQERNEMLEEQNLVLREELNSLKSNMARKTFEHQDQKKALQDEQDRRMFAERVLRHIAQGLKEVLAQRPSDEDDDDKFDVIFHMRRNDALQNLLKLLNRSIERIEANEVLRPAFAESKMVRLAAAIEDSTRTDWHLKASHLMSHYNVIKIPKPRPVHSMPSMSTGSRTQIDTLRPYASATEPLLTTWRAQVTEEEVTLPKETVSVEPSLSETVTQQETQELNNQ
ncbi:hypothetical protein JD844_005015 [Phrynosoma platyrhinos]|uniref:Cilia- and flagella-associated protein 157 n=1 Tax=Phrynosoma platyrhinos TaxID=52577 RepID=A0ABQ7SE18_PHRPL|nr:hypothetical protein JD844_005015 [Phrynosoma platyrhinos]